MDKKNIKNCINNNKYLNKIKRINIIKIKNFILIIQQNIKHKNIFENKI